MWTSSTTRTEPSTSTRIPRKGTPCPIKNIQPDHQRCLVSKETQYHLVQPAHRNSLRSAGIAAEGIERDKSIRTLQAPVLPEPEQPINILFRNNRHPQRLQRCQEILERVLLDPQLRHQLQGPRGVLRTLQDFHLQVRILDMRVT